MEGERREPEARFERREPFLCFWEEEDFLEGRGSRFRDWDRGPGFFKAEVVFLRPGLPEGPTLPARLVDGVVALGVPGPREECRAWLGVGIGRGPRLPLSLRRFASGPPDMLDMSRMMRGFPVCVAGLTIVAC